MLEHEGDSTEDKCYWQAPWRSLPESLLPIQPFPCLLPGNILSFQGFCLTYRSVHDWLGFIARLSKAWHRPLTGESCLMEIRGPDTKMAELLTSSLRRFHITGRDPPKVQGLRLKILSASVLGFWVQMPPTLPKLIYRQWGLSLVTLTWPFRIYRGGFFYWDKGEIHSLLHLIQC